MAMDRKLTDAERIDLFVKPCSRLLDERVDTLARIYAAALTRGSTDHEIARAACIDFLKMIEPMDAD